MGLSSRNGTMDIQNLLNGMNTMHPVFNVPSRRRPSPAGPGLVGRTGQGRGNGGDGEGGITRPGHPDAEGRQVSLDVNIVDLGQPPSDSTKMLQLAQMIVELLDGELRQENEDLTSEEEAKIQGQFIENYFQSSFDRIRSGCTIARITENQQHFCDLINLGTSYANNNFLPRSLFRDGNTSGALLSKDASSEFWDAAALTLHSVYRAAIRNLLSGIRSIPNEITKPVDQASIQCHRLAEYIDFVNLVHSRMVEIGTPTNELLPEDACIAT